MAVTTPPTITALPAAPDRADRATFSARATAMFSALKDAFVGEVGAVATNVFNNATDAATSASTASSAASTATTQASNASSSASSASTSASTATTKAAEAAASALAAAGGAPGLILVATSDITSSTATVDFTGISNSSDEWELHVINAVPVTDAAAPWLRTSTDGGSTYAASNGDYGWTALAARTTSSTPSIDNGTTSATHLSLAAGEGIENTTANGGFSCVIRLIDPAGTAHHKQVNWLGGGMSSTSNRLMVTGSGARLATADVDAIRFMFSSGDIASGKFRLYRIKKS